MKTGLVIVEIDNHFRENLKLRMEVEGFKVYVAGSLIELTRQLERRNIEVVLLSLMELKREGLKHLEAIRKLKSTAEIIIINNSESVDLSIEGMKLGAFDDFYLPFDMNHLAKRVKEAALKAREVNKGRKPVKQKIAEMVIAMSLAEGGSPDLAHDYLNRSKRPKKQKDV